MNNKIENKIYAPIIKKYDKYIILAQSESDYKAKERKIRQGDTRGFYFASDYKIVCSITPCMCTDIEKCQHPALIPKPPTNLHIEEKQ